MSVALTQAGLRENATQNLEFAANEVEQEKLPDPFRDYIAALAKVGPSALNVVIDLDRGVADIARRLPKLADDQERKYAEQKRALVLMFMRDLKTFDVHNFGSQFAVQISIAPDRLVPLRLPEANTAAKISMLDAIHGTKQTSLVPAADEPPDLSYLEVPAGMMIISQPVSGFINRTHNVVELLNESGSNLYNSSRERDKQPSGDEDWIDLSHTPKSALEQEALRKRAEKTAQPPSANESTTNNSPNDFSRGLPWLIGAGIMAGGLDEDEDDYENQEHELQDPLGHGTHTIVVGEAEPGEVPGFITHGQEVDSTEAGEIGLSYNDVENGVRGRIPSLEEAENVEGLHAGIGAQHAGTHGPKHVGVVHAGVVHSELNHVEALNETAETEVAETAEAVELNETADTEPAETAETELEETAEAETVEEAELEAEAEFEAAEAEVAEPEAELEAEPEIERPEAELEAAAEQAEQDVQDLMEGRGYIPDTEENALREQAEENATEQGNEAAREATTERTEQVETDFENAAEAETEQRIDEAGRDEVQEAHVEDLETHGYDADSRNDDDENNDVEDREQLAHETPRSPDMPDTPENEVNRDMTPAGIDQDQYHTQSGGYPDGRAPNNLSPEGITPIGQTPPQVGGVAPASVSASATPAAASASNIAPNGATASSTASAVHTAMSANEALSSAGVAPAIPAAGGIAGTAATQVPGDISRVVGTASGGQVPLPPTAATVSGITPTPSLSEAAIAAAPSVAVGTTGAGLAQEVAVEGTLEAAATTALKDQPTIEPPHEHTADEEQTSDAESLPEALLLGSLRRRRLNKKSDTAPTTTPNPDSPSRRPVNNAPNARGASKARVASAKARPTMQNTAKAELLKKPHHPDQAPKPPGEEPQNTPT